MREQWLQIPNKTYFRIGEVAKLCLLETHVLRYWEQEFPQLKPSKRCGNRRYYNRDEILLIRRIKTLLYEQGFTIEGARTKLSSEKNHASEVGDKVNTIIKNVVAQLEDVLIELECS